MRLNETSKNILLIIIVISAPLLILGLINGWSYIVKVKECHSSAENLMSCQLASVCKNKGITSDCFEALKEYVSENTNRALAANNSKICEEVEPKLRFLCYYQFGKKLEFTLEEVFINNLKGQDLELCSSLSGQLRKKCFFNLALQNQDPHFCTETNELNQKCMESISLIWNRVSHDDLYIITKPRKEPKTPDLSIKLIFLLDLEEYLVGERGWLKIYNDGDSNLTGSNFYLFKNLRLVDVDGCRNNVLLYSGRLVMESWGDESDPRLCYLDFSTEAKNRILEVTYDGKTVLVDAGCTSESCREKYSEVW